MHVLVIGGTRFVGRHLVQCLIDRGHEVTLFNRAKSGADIFSVETIVGDRDGEVDKLGGRQWDAVVDTCGYVPRVVEQSAYQLEDAVSLYCFISTISVYADGQPTPVGEEGALQRFAEIPANEAIDAESYGPFKVLCEEAVTRIMGEDRALVIRPGLIVGPYDPTDRFTYWIDRYASRERILLPDRFQQPIQFIDARDLAEFTVRRLEDRVGATFNVTGPAHPTVMGDVWGVLKQNCGGTPEEVVVSDRFLEENDVKAWQDLPFVTPPGDDLAIASISRALGAGLTIRRMAETVADTAAWHASRGIEPVLKAGMTRERERELLDQWAAART